MRITRFAAIATVWLVVLFAATPVLAQSAAAQGKGGGRGGGGGGNKPPSCSDDPFPAEMHFSSNAGLGPAIFATDGSYLTATVSGGNIEGTTETASGSMYYPFPVGLDFPAGSGYPVINAPAETILVDPRVQTDVFLQGNDDKSAVPCQMFDMAVDENASFPAAYRMKLTVIWYERGGDPILWEDQDTEQRWSLRYRPHKPETPITWLVARRTANNVWELTSRSDSDPEHFGALEKAARGKGKNKTQAAHTTPEMPITLTIIVDCGGPAEDPGCAVPVGGS